MCVSTLHCVCGESASCNTQREGLVCGDLLVVVCFSQLRFVDRQGKDSGNDWRTSCVLCSPTQRLFLFCFPFAVNVFIRLSTTVFALACVSYVCLSDAYVVALEPTEENESFSYVFVLQSHFCSYLTPTSSVLHICPHKSSLV